ncbi:alpha/beta fold hydrolase [Methyloceanibacter sp. wino2]|uniref:alpha/beta fold hydrolase n=1 Tax=Methyloceanibacter sp. wino2 TaxID=2170729 RepID=UPI001FE065A8|nr:alpha/beta hydrolase [Methyloceanibacter sp. wino2]
MARFHLISLVFAALVPLGFASTPAHAEEPVAAEEPAFDARLSGYAYPFDVQTLALKNQRQDLEMAYMYLPAKGDAPTVVLLHGKNFNGAYWGRTAEFLAARGYGVLMPDQIGFGKSSKPTSYQYSFNQLAANTAALMDDLRIDKAVIVGHSMGGMLAARFALAYPERTERLVLVNPIGLEDYLDYTTYPDIAAAFEREKGLTGADIVAYQRKNYYDGAWSDAYDALTIPLRGWINGPDSEQLAYVSALTYDMILTQPVIDDFELLAVPTTLIIGTRDRTGPNRANKRPGVTRELGRYDRLGKEAASRIPNAQLIELDGLGHLPQIEDFDRFKDALLQALGAD